MSININWKGPEINNKGLVFYSDINSPNSYYGTNYIYDLTSRYTGSFTGSISYTDSFGGFVHVSDNTGVSARIGLGNAQINDLFQTTASKFTIQTVVRFHTFSNANAPYGCVLFGNMYDSLIHNGIQFRVSADGYPGTYIVSYDGGASYFYKFHQNALSTNAWYVLAMTYDGTGGTSGIKFYVNGNLTTGSFSEGDTTGTNSLLSTASYYICSSTNATPGQMDGDFALIQLYNRNLSDEEIYNNYVQYKSRFGI